ncbi:uncharacterized protein [Chelonus insularis]|uniref:uncharacterized protein n=1 Tax=Chelonus insularis TaxID=460826 RepID=UPI00158CF447|nr:uncharacterized protein LOC118070417 [Chelonus insularis]XP_034944903.1 uncharacterized protein LOC118070417 [Chelonus insularis]
MSSDNREIVEEIPVPSAEKERRKIWQDNPNSQVPRSTYYRWKSIQRRCNLDEDSSSETSEPDSDVNSSIQGENDSFDVSNSTISESSTDNEEDGEKDHEEDSEEDNDNLDERDLVAESDDEQIIEDSDDEHNSTNSYEVDSNSSIASMVNALYDGSDISLTRSILLLMNLYIQNKLTKTSLQALLIYIQEILPKPNNMPKTLHNLFKFIENEAHSARIIKYYYCKKCLFYNNTNPVLTKCPSCSSTEGTSFFFEIDLVEQIKYLFEERNLANKLHVSNHEPNVITDITDGSEYKRVNSHQKRGKFDLTLILNTDGISIVKSSKSNCWPLMFMIAELPEHLRESFICIIGIWYDSTKKPLMNTFLQPFCEKLITCFYDGITWVDPATKETCTTRITAPLFIADAPARAEIQNIQYFTGKYGCNICEIKMKRCQVPEGKKRIRAYIFSEKVSRLRSDDRMTKQAEIAFKDNLPHKRGVKGISIVSAIPLLKLETCVLPEYMHSVLLGVGKQFINLWFHKKGVWNIKQFVSEIDDKLKDIHPPYFFNRMPRSLKYLPFYKASEFYNVVLFYSIPIFFQYLPDLYFQHWLLFVVAIFSLLEKPIYIDSELKRAEILLQLFVRDIKELYRDRQYTYNVHQLLHLTLCIERWGPLWSTSAFPFENVNGMLAKCVHGTKNLGQEMANNLKIAQGVQSLKITCASKNNTVDFFSNQSQKPELKDNINITECNDYRLIEIVKTLNFNIDNTHFFARAIINNRAYSSTTYKKTQTNSYTVKINLNDKMVYGEIVVFTKIEEKLGYIVRTFDVDYTKRFCHRESNTIVQHILPIIETNNFIKIDAENVECIVHVIRVLDFICERPNNLNKVM